MELKNLEIVLGRGEVLDELHQRLTAPTIRALLRALLPEFAVPQAPKDIDGAARCIYMYTKLLSYMVLVSKHRTSERTEDVAITLLMGQCLRRFVDARLVRTPSEAKALVSACGRISEHSSLPLQLAIFDICMLVLGAWKSGRHLLVPYLYQLGCRQWSVGNERYFQRLSALVLSFYVREHADSIGPSVIRGLLADVNQRQIRLLPYHYSMLILYFGKTGNPGEALRVFEQAMDDPEAHRAEVIYYNMFRAFGSAFAQRKRRGNDSCAAESSLADGLYDAGVRDGVDMLDEGYVTGYVDRLDDEALDAGGTTELSEGETGQGAGRWPSRLQAAKTCMGIFQAMTNSGIDIGFRTYRELMYCMFQFDMPDKALRVFEFALEILDGTEVKAHFITLYLQLAAPTPHRRQLMLRGMLKENDDLLMAMRSFSKRTLVDQFGIFDGDLDAFASGAARPAAAAERGGEFLRRFLFRMYKARRAAAFVRCMLAGNDPTGEFKGYNFPKLRSDGSGLADVESEVVEACRRMHELRPAWLRHRDVIHALLPVLAGAACDTGADPGGVGFIRHLVAGCRDIEQFTARLDDAHIEGYDMELVNHFLRVKYLCLTFQRYAKEKAVAGGDRRGRLFWPSFMYTMSNGPIVLGDSSPLASIERDAYAREVAAAIPAAMASWAQLTDACRSHPRRHLHPNGNTVSIFSCIAGYAEDWAFGLRIWDDVFRLMGRPEAADSGGAQPLPGPAWPLEYVRTYRCYLNLAAQATLAHGHARGRVPYGQLAFGEDMLVDMLAVMDRNGVDVTSGLLCQGIAAAYRVGQIDIGGALEQWQLHRERRGLAPAGYLQQYFTSQGLPEVPAELTSVLGLVRGAAGCPRLMQLIEQKTRRRGP